MATEPQIPGPARIPVDPSRRSRNRLPKLVLRHALAGLAGGLVFAIGVVASDGAGLGRLILGDDSPAAALALWSLGIAAGFATLAVALAVMAIGGVEDDDPPSPHRLRPRPRPAQVPVRPALRR